MMSPHREQPWWAPLGLFLIPVCACTLGSDYEPPYVEAPPAEESPSSVASPAAMLQQATVPSAALALDAQRPDAGTTPSCSASSELAGCELMRVDPTPAPSAPSCSDGIRNQGESAVDCAGPCAARCAEGDDCSSSADCAQGLSCPPATRRCAPPSCQDGLQNGGETGLDCGGGCAGCAAGSACQGAGDCVTGICRDGTCAAPSCDDLVRNQDETDIDCGGVCAPCAPGRACALDSDCQSGACQDGSCCGGQEADCTRCARRLSTSLQCTSNGTSAEVAAACNDFLQCLSDNVAQCPRRRAAGCSDAGGACDISRFGGNGNAVSLADGILGTARCSF